CFFHHFIAMQFLSGEYDKRRLTVPVHFYLKYFGTKYGGSPVIIFLNKIKYQVKKRVGTSIGIDSIFISYQFTRLQINFRKHRSEIIGSSPMCRATPSIQQAR